MRKVLLLLAFLPFLFACSNSIENVAMNNIDKCINDLVVAHSSKRNNSVEYVHVSNKEVVYSDDSICVVDCDVEIKVFGEELEKTDLEYIFFKDFYLSEVEGKDVFFEWANGESHKYDLYERSLESGKELFNNEDYYVSFYSEVMESYWREKFERVTR